MRSWVYGATYGAASSAIVLVVGSLLIPRNDVVSDEPPAAQINSEDLAATASAEGKVKPLSGTDDVVDTSVKSASKLPDEPVLDRSFAGEVQLSIPEIGAMEIADLAQVPAEVPVIPLTIGNWGAPRVELVGLGEQPLADERPMADLSKPPYYGVGLVLSQDNTPTDEVQTAEANVGTGTIAADGTGTIASDGTFGRAESRLPQVESTEQSEAVAEAEALDDGALTVNAAAWVDTGLPKIAVLLTGYTPDFALPAVGDLPFSVIVSALDAEADSQISNVRAAGQEVVLAAPLPEGATASDAQVSFETYRPLLGSSVALMEAGDGQFRSRDVAQAVIDLSVGEGLAVVSVSKGLNPVMQIAGPAGAHAAMIERDVTDVASDASALRRALDQAAFKAGQEGAIILLAPATPDVVAVLREWLETSRGKTVSLAPVSAVLRKM